MVPGQNPLVPPEIVYESADVRVTRLFLAGHAVIRTEPLGVDAQRRLRHERAILERLRGVEGMPQLVAAPQYPGAIVVADPGRTSLAEVAMPLAVDDLIGLAVAVGRAMAGMHGRGVVHRDITPDHIMIAAYGSPCLVDFALATSFAGIRPEFTHHSEIVGTLAYLAPEQTGRTGRSVDQRADLYAFGATLYELATGDPPFGFGDPLRLTHEHLARVPVPPAEVNPAVPQPLSEIIMHLLEKEPDNRYQTAEGVVYDLERLREGRAGTAAPSPRVGEHDVPLRLLPPSRLVGRDDEVAALKAAFADARAGRCRGVLISGAAGVGKTALADELRPAVADADGWFVAGKFDQYRRDREFDAVHQATRAVGRLLLAEPEDDLAAVRERILAAVGTNAGLLAATIPEFGALLGVPPEAGDPLTTQVRAQRAAAAVLRAVASRSRPLVFFVDDLQWAGRSALGFVDLVLSEERVDGLLLVGAYRDDGIDVAHPLEALLSRWSEQALARHLPLVNLSGAGLVTLVAEMLHVAQATATSLVEVIGANGSGNPYEIVELLNALRQDGVLVATSAGWRWDAAAVRAQLGESELSELLRTRIDAMPASSRMTVEAMACLGGRTEMGLILAATGEPVGVVERKLTPAFDSGILVVDPGAREALRFRHDRIRETVLLALEPSRRAALQLVMARRLAGLPEFSAVAAEQYLQVLDAVDDADERRAVVDLLRGAADRAALVGEYSLVNALLAGALRMIDPVETGTLIEVHGGRHAALFGLGFLDEADEEYRTIEGIGPTAMQRAQSTAVQVRSLTHRNRFAEAIRLGLDSLRELGLAFPAPDRLPTELDQQLNRLYWWLEHTEAAEDVSRPAITDPALLAMAGLIDAMLPSAYFDQDFAAYGWLSLEALRILIEHGPARALIGPAAHAASNGMVQRGDYLASYRGHQRIVALGKARGYEPGTSQARLVAALLSCWVEPIENGVRNALQAREGLLEGGDLANAGYTYYATVTGQLDSAPSLRTCVAEVEAGLAFSRRTGSEQTGQLLEGYRWFTDALRGEGESAAGEVAPDAYLGNPQGLFHAHLTRALAAAIFDDPARLARHTAAAMPLAPAALGLYPTALARLLLGLALAGQVRANRDGDPGPLAALDEAAQWLGERAADAPANFQHLLRLFEAERAWAVGDFRAAVLAFDAARREVAQQSRPWHRALIAERAASFYLAHGVDQAGYDLLAEARHEYLAWGATAKVDQLDWAHPTLRPEADPTADGGVESGDFPPRRSLVTTGTIDLLGILSASQALSSETDIERLHPRVVGVLSAMTGATDVHLLQWSDDRQDWLLGVPGDQSGAVSAGDPDRDHAAPMSVLRYVERMREPLVVDDTIRDDRFARDPYFTDATCCSLLAVPILSRGMLSAVLVLENRLIRRAFTTERLDAVRLIAGQLAVSLDNVRLYAEFRRIADEQTALRRVATLVAHGFGPDVVFAAVAKEVGTVFGADGATIVRFEPDGEMTVLGGYGMARARSGWRGRPNPAGVMRPIQATGRAARCDLEAGLPVPPSMEARSAVACPIVVEGKVWGAVGVESKRDRLPQDTEQRLAEFTELVATAIANTESRTELTRSRARIVAAADHTRRRIEQNLHDGAQQRLVALAVRLRAAQAGLPPGLDELTAQLDHAVDEATDAVEELRETARGIHPAILADGGLLEALPPLARRSPIPVDLQVHVDGRLNEQVELAGYYVVAEALTNAAKHADATTVTVTVTVDTGPAGADLRVEVDDDGVGGADFTRGTGLVGLKDRVEALGGRIVLHSPRGEGTNLRVHLALTAPNEGISS